MKFTEKEIELKDGTLCTLRSLDENYSEEVIKYLKMTSEETDFMVRYSEEIDSEVDKERVFLNESLNSDKSMMIGAFINNEFAGNVGITCVGNYIKIRHRAVFGIAIKERYWNKGIGNALLKEVIEETKKMGYEQIELGVFSNNEKAQALYKKHGFEVLGKVKNAFRLKDGTYIDQITMGRMI